MLIHINHPSNPRCRWHVESGIGFRDNQNGSLLLHSGSTGCTGILAQSSIDPLQRVQNAAARLITGTGTRENITPALRSLHWLPVKFRITFKLCVLMHLVHIGHAPAYPSDMVTATADLSSRGRLRSSNTFRSELPLLKRKVGERRFSYAGPKAWNDLPFALQELTDTCTFKRQLKIQLFTPAYTNCRA